ncbi:MAG: hypothetical protein ACXADS_10260 [Candidatus Thorarchaeota archaeon]|jgi:hypothetical protein
MSIKLRRIVFLTVLLWLSSSVLLLAGSEMTTKTNLSGESVSEFSVSEADLDRVEWQTNHFPDPGFEYWSEPHAPERLSTWRTTEHYAWYASTPDPVNEGSGSLGLQARAVDANHPAEAQLSRSSWIYWNNPTNLTLKFDWYIDELPVPTDSDYFRIEVRLGSPASKPLYYYFGSQDTTRSNTTSYAYHWVTGPTKTWNVFDRNITEDFFDAFGMYPTQFQQFRFELLSESNAYSRAFIDDLWMVNDTVIIGGSTENGNFNSLGSWYLYSNNDAADISQSSVRQEGDWSLNATSVSSGNVSYASITVPIDRWASSLNPDRFSFQWMIDDFDQASEFTYAFVAVNCMNDTSEWNIYYVLCRGGTTNEFGYPGEPMVNATGFNVTGQWNTFDRSIFNDMNAVNQTDFLIIDTMYLYIYTRTPGARISILFDDMSFASAALDDMSYEDQLGVGEELWIWRMTYGPSPYFTVTDSARTGLKAANLTLSDGEYFDGIQSFYRPINSYTDTFLDMFWRIEDLTGVNMLFIELYFSTGEAMAYILANGTDVPMANGFDAFILLPEVNTVGVWNNLVRNLYNDYVTAFGSEPDTMLEEIILIGDSDPGARIEVLFDDVYLYDDPAPEISNVERSPSEPAANEAVNVTVEVYDPSLDEVILYYQVDNGTWIDVEMTLVGGIYNATIPGQGGGALVEFYIEAADAFENVARSEHLSYTIPTPPPDSGLLLLVVGGGAAAAVVIVVVYFKVIRPKSTPE